MTTIAQAGRKSTEPLRPEPATVLEVIQETPNIRTLRLAFDDPSVMEAFSFLPGQIGQLSVLGAGESTFAISSAPSGSGSFEFSIMKAGVVTGAIHELAAGDRTAVRAPMGCGFPTDEWKGKNIVLVAGGIGMAPLRSLLFHLLDNRGDYGELTLVYGARTPADLCYEAGRADWQQRSGLDFTATIDAACEGWDGCVGLVPNVLEERGPSPENSVAVTCGPPIMIRFTLQSLSKMGFREEQIYTTLERRMKCGIGICGRCNLGPKYVCTDGPVFSLQELRELPEEL
ncbi:MAG: FAD/NAD(P)-binding protein [Actinobacteria bacterium]|nr:FAD/NAD(P)-binding protein [Actinomycetota bacterium]MCL5883042.1 FAD/NAD(P)-binding protein [Actinomycetota bacterium]